MESNENQPVQTQKQEVLPPTDAQTIESKPVKKNRLRKFVFIFIIVFLIIAAAGIGLIFFTFQNIKDSKSSPLDNPVVMNLVEKMPIPKITVVPITLIPSVIPTLQNTAPGSAENQINQQDQPTAVPTTTKINIEQNWNKYSNTQLKFSLNYPAGFKIIENSKGLGVEDISFSSPDNSDPKNIPDYQILIYPNSIGKLIGQDFERLYELPAQSTQLLSSEGSDTQQFTKLENITLNGLRAFEYSSSSYPPDPTEDEETGFYIEIQKSTLIITTSKSNKEVLDQMIKSFQSS